ncbi:hypothetical protein JWG39_14405 [Desulforhopalus vacuolatus]|uniref:hypothetical protein n=1 Tax=Desulforhopalus vacuolatus TaxID=40414 RepID=UPI001963E68C|nr:hypothetical protein [Desulforhopalus vacuolatus]MBM9521009.1 hypothetical protein [Desulforhopalus vacuolatus]
MAIFFPVKQLTIVEKRVNRGAVMCINFEESPQNGCEVSWDYGRDSICQKAFETSSSPVSAGVPDFDLFYRDEREGR